ncbi:MAG TPA: aspartate-semialdehyde dehydrogenase [Methanothermobacter sp.]|nr:aspartate-semialdehyde dehydrogenase [Methanothermobacter sp. MT-2]HHW05251.1 aspartate-semialdehyde dehydrogenase [Methanothermobacter sp.]HOK72863.1 aspartate-semialdehyde dehydrogenase [Methanothermobacter sp.]HOL69052.1 aspartate-semialdehyde dehydrogenase [Methanothermobacter sp.]HPQ04812.1 aspartate-semialdehyde dehydrogenase [Methanothermobacter sp.]
MVDVGVLGATGMVGQRFIELLDKHPKFEIKVLTASPRSEGKPYGEVAKWYLQSEMPESVKDIIVAGTDPSKVGDVDILFSALPPEIAAKVEPKFAEEYVVASNASAMRMEPDVPLVIPEVNPDFLDLIEVQQKRRGWDGFIVTNPNCTTIALTLTLKPIHDQYTIKRVYVATMQAVSGAGYNGVPSMAIIDNLVPYIGGEEEKIETETLHLLGELENGTVTPAQFGISASCHRVPVLDGHTEAVFIELEEEFEIDDIKRIMDEFQGIPQKLELPSAPEKPVVVREEEDRPQPRIDRDESGGMAVTVGRLRMDDAFENSLRYVLVGHNTIRGAAGASILNAELINEIIF